MLRDDTGQASVVVGSGMDPPGVFDEAHLFFKLGCDFLGDDIMIDA